MRIGHLIAIVSLSVACGAPFANAEGSPRIAVVRPFQIMKDSQEFKDYSSTYKTKSEQLNAAFQKKQHDIQVLTDQRSQYKPSAPSYTELSAKIDQTVTDFKAWQQIVERQGEREKKQAVRDLFSHIQAATAKVAKAQQIDLVLTEGEVEVPDIETLTYQELMMDIAGRSVLYSSNALDISNAVLTQADADYAASKKASSAATPAQPTSGNAKPQGPVSNH